MTNQLSCFLCIIVVLLAVPRLARSGHGHKSGEASATIQAGQKEPVARGGGMIQGRVIFDGKAPPRQKLIVVKDRDICGRTDHYDQRLIVGKQGGIQNAVVSLTKVRGGKPLSAIGTEPVLDQKGCSYSPHVLLLPVNHDVKILNNDGLLHNIHTFSTKNRPLNIAQTKFQKELKMKFAVPERISVKCDVHGWMSAWFVVVDHPYHFITNEEGSFVLKNIPAGTYTVSCWQELLGEQTAQATVEAGSAVTMDFRYSAEKKVSGSN